MILKKNKTTNWEIFGYNFYGVARGTEGPSQRGEWEEGSGRRGGVGGEREEGDEDDDDVARTSGSQD